MDRPIAPARRDTYHHGDLASALTDAAAGLARTGGPDAVVLREAARRVGVSATAAYRHFAGHRDLIDAVKQRALGALADSMRARVASGTPLDDPASDAVRRLRAIGTAYAAFALAEPGLFRTAFCAPDPDADAESMRSALGQAAPYLLLSNTVEDLVEHGALPPERREYAEVHLWATVHGLSVLLLDGPLRMLPPADQAVLIEATIDFCAAGLGLPGGSR